MEVQREDEGAEHSAGVCQRPVLWAEVSAGGCPPQGCFCASRFLGGLEIIFLMILGADSCAA